MGGAGEEMSQETASDMCGWWRKHQVGVTRRHRRWAARKRNHVVRRLYAYIGHCLEKELKREFWCEWRKNQKVSLEMPETGNKKGTPCKDAYLKTASRTPLWWVELEYTLHIALCSYSCVGVAAMARNRNKRRSPTSFLPHPGNPCRCALLTEMPLQVYTTETQKRNPLSWTSGTCLTQSCWKICILKKWE